MSVFIRFLGQRRCGTDVVQTLWPAEINQEEKAEEQEEEEGKTSGISEKEDQNGRGGRVNRRPQR